MINFYLNFILKQKKTKMNKKQAKTFGDVVKALTEQVEWERKEWKEKNKLNKKNAQRNEFPPFFFCSTSNSVVWYSVRGERQRRLTVYTKRTDGLPSE